MTCHVHAFDAREGGVFRISLTYDVPTQTGNSSGREMEIATLKQRPRRNVLHKPLWSRFFVNN